MDEVDRQRKLFEVFVRQNEGPLWAYLRATIRDPGLVDDLFQETLITAWRRFDDYDPSRPLGPWLRGIALNLARNADRRRRREPVIVGEAAEVAIEQTVARLESRTGDDWVEKLSLLRPCLDELTDRSRDLIRRRYENRETSVQIAASGNRSEAAVRKQLQRVRSMLADCIRRRLVMS